MADKDEDRDDLEEDGDEAEDDGYDEDEADDDEDEADDDADEADDDADDADDDADDADDADDDDDDDDADDADDDADDDDGDADDEDDADDDDGDADDEPPDSGRAEAVAKALGLDEDGEGEDGDGSDAPANRAERRRQRALRRRARRSKRAEVDEADTPGARDRNKRKRDKLLARRRRAAAASDDEETPDRLLPSEMVDDALARGSAAMVNWLRRNWTVVQWVIVASLVGGGALLYWTYRADSQSADASDILASGIRAEEATIIPKDADDRDEDQKKVDVRRVFETEKARDEAALKAYRDVGANHGKSGAAILAKLGEAGLLLDKREWDKAISAYSAVLDSPLAAADSDVKVRALEGQGFAQEGKKDLDSALKTFAKLADVKGGANKALSNYHQARVYVVRKDSKKAIELLKEARKSVETATLESLKVTGTSPHKWLARAIDDELKILDPSAVPASPAGGGVLPEQIRQKLQQQGLTPPPGLGQ